MSLATLQLLCSKDTSEIATEEADARCERYRWFAAEAQNYALTYVREAQRQVGGRAQLASLETQLTACLRECERLRMENSAMRAQLNTREFYQQRCLELERDIERFQLRAVRAEAQAERSMQELCTVRNATHLQVAAEVERTVTAHLCKIREDGAAAIKALRVELASCKSSLTMVLGERDSLRRYLEDALNCRARVVKELLHVQSCKSPAGIVHYS